MLHSFFFCIKFLTLLIFFPCWSHWISSPVPAGIYGNQSLQYWVQFLLAKNGFYVFYQSENWVNLSLFDSKGSLWNFLVQCGLVARWGWVTAHSVQLICGFGVEASSEKGGKFKRKQIRFRFWDGRGEVIFLVGVHLDNFLILWLSWFMYSQYKGIVVNTLFPYHLQYGTHYNEWTMDLCRIATCILKERVQPSITCLESTESHWHN